MSKTVLPIWVTLFILTLSVWSSAGFAADETLPDRLYTAKVYYELFYTALDAEIASFEGKLARNERVPMWWQYFLGLCYFERAEYGTGIPMTRDMARRVAEKDYRSAINAFDALLKDAKIDDSSTLHILAMIRKTICQLRLNAKTVNEVERLFKEIATESHNHPRVLTELGRAADEAKLTPDLAREWLERAVEIVKTRGESDENPKVFSQNAVLCQRNLAFFKFRHDSDWAMLESSIFTQEEVRETYVTSGGNEVEEPFWDAIQFWYFAELQMARFRQSAEERGQALLASHAASIIPLEFGPYFVNWAINGATNEIESKIFDALKQTVEGGHQPPPAEHHGFELPETWHPRNKVYVRTLILSELGLARAVGGNDIAGGLRLCQEAMELVAAEHPELSFEIRMRYRFVYRSFAYLNYLTARQLEFAAQLTDNSEERQEMSKKSLVALKPAEDAYQATFSANDRYRVGTKWVMRNPPLHDAIYLIRYSNVRLVSGNDYFALPLQTYGQELLLTAYPLTAQLRWAIVHLKAQTIR